jgi:phosphatidylglycerol:prolipoprotein diacylglycerol transferase
MQPVLMQVGPFAIRWYGLMIALACVIALWVAGKEADRKGIGKKQAQDFFLYAMLGGLVGARLYYMAFMGREQLWNNPFSFFAIWQGGLAIHGAILGGLLATILFTRKHNIPFLKFADTMTPSLILGQAIGRVGCFFNGDAHGYPTTLPWGLIYSQNSPAGQMFPGQPLHPTQIYEMVLNLIIFGILWKMRKKWEVDGHLFLIYVILYSLIRIFVEHFRADKLTYLGNISAAQSLGIIGIIIGFTLILVLKKKQRLIRGPGQMSPLRSHIGGVSGKPRCAKIDNIK